MERSGLKVKKYRYLDRAKNTLDEAGYACAHEPLTMRASYTSRVATARYTHPPRRNRPIRRAHPDCGRMLADVNSAPRGSIFLLHAVAHNPTGVDPTREQWATISAAILRKGHHVLMDCAYQGFASGDAEADAFAIRFFLAEGHSMTLAQSFAKNFGLYGERVGAFSVVCASKATAGRVLSQLKCAASLSLDARNHEAPCRPSRCSAVPPPLW